MSYLVSLKLGLAALVLSATASGAAALPPLSENSHINGALLPGFIGDIIAKNCPDIEPRKLRAVVKLYELRDYAIKQGYSRDAITSFVKDKAEKARLKASAEAYLQAKGTVAGDAASYCRIGMQEIEKNTATGWLLYAK